MARKGKNKKINKKKFKNRVCRNCKLCTGNFFPSFCFNKFYKQNPKKFTHIMPGKYKKYKFVLKLLLEGNKDNLITPLSFRRIFCNTDICMGCSKSAFKILKCMEMFKDQVHIQNIKKSIKRKAPTVFILCSDDKDFKKEVKLILENNNKQ